MDYVTKDDFKHLSKDIKDLSKDTKEDIKEHIDLLIKPIIKNLEDMETILIGATKINGVVGGLKNVDKAVGIIKIKLIVISGFLLGVIGLLVKLLFFKTI